MRMPHQAAADRCPQTYGQKRADEDRCKLQNCWLDRLCRSQPGEAAGNDRATDDQPQDEETHAGPAWSECREKAPHKYSSLSVPVPDIAAKPRQGLSKDSFQSVRLLAGRASGLDKPALNGDHGGVGPVGRAQFGENILDATLDAVFRNRKPCGDLFVRLSGCD
jgi:hypothetical protein